MDFSGDTLKSQINRDAISIMIPGVLVLTLVALIFDHLNYVHLESWLSGPALVLGFVFAYILGYVFRELSWKLLIGIFAKFAKKELKERSKKNNEDLQMSYYYMALRKRFRIDDLNIESEEEEFSFVTSLSQDLIKQKKLINLDDQSAQVGLFSSLISLSIIWTIFAFITFVLNLTPGWFGIIHLVLITTISTGLIWFFYSLIKDQIITDVEDFFAQAGMYVLLENKDLFVKRIKGPNGVELEYPDYGIDKVAEESKPTDVK